MFHRRTGGRSAHASVVRVDRLAWIAAVVAVSVAVPADGAAPPCRGTLSGSVKGSFQCTAAVGAGPDGKLYFVITPAGPIEKVPAYAPGAFEIPAPVVARRYTLETLGMGRASVAAEGGALYTATKTTSRRGEVTLSLHSVKPDPKAKGAFLVRGTYRARLLPAGSGKHGEVVVDVTF